jgi:pimeloyl-ACP methyl ester carboxylesterase
MVTNMKIRGINLVYDDLGQGEVIVFIHGQPFNRSMWKYQTEVFAKTHRLIIPDLRNYGESDVIKGKVLLDELALDIIHLLEALNIKQAIFAGLSMGGQIVFEIFRLRPELFKGMILADTDARAETEEGYLNRMNLSDKMEAEGMKSFTDERIHLFVGKQVLEENGAILNHLRNMMEQTSPAGSAAVQRGRAERRDHSEILPAIQCPVLIIVGAEDGFTPVATSVYIHQLIPDSQLAIIENSGHIPNMEQTERFNKVVIDFLNHFRL